MITKKEKKLGYGYRSRSGYRGELWIATYRNSSMELSFQKQSICLHARAYKRWEKIYGISCHPSMHAWRIDAPR